MKLVPTVSAWFLALVFLFAGIDKAAHYEGFVNALASYAIVPAALASTLAPVVILAELWIGIGLLWPAWRGRAALLGAATLSIFTLALAHNQLYAPGSVCGCWFTFTLAESSGMHMAQNAVLVALALTVWWDRRSAQPLPVPIARPQPERRPG